MWARVQCYHAMRAESSINFESESEARETQFGL